MTERPILGFDASVFESVEFDPKKDLVTILGYIGHMVTGEYLHLHHQPEYRAYYKIPLDAIYSSKLSTPTRQKGLYELRIHRDAALRYFLATTVEMKASGLASAIEHKQKQPKPEPVPGKLKSKAVVGPCNGMCSSWCCPDHVCICATALTSAESADLFGFKASTPKD